MVAKWGGFTSSDSNATPPTSVEMAVSYAQPSDRARVHRKCKRHGSKHDVGKKEEAPPPQADPTPDMLQGNEQDRAFRDSPPATAQSKTHSSGFLRQSHRLLAPQPDASPTAAHEML